MKIPLARSRVSDEEAAAISRVIDRGRLALGPEVKGFEEEFASWLAVHGAVATNSGTSALTALHRLSGYEDLCVQRSPLDNSDDIGRRLLCLPLWVGMDDGTIETIATELSNAIGF